MNIEPLKITRDALKSEQVRNFIGERIFDPTNDEEVPRGNNQPQEGMSLWNWLLGAVLLFTGWKFKGFLIKTALRFFVIGNLVAQIWEIIVEQAFNLAYTDWNQMDSEIERKIQTNEERIASAAGSLVASGLVWTASIVIAGKMVASYPVVSGKVLLALSEEGQGEIRGQFINFLTTTRQVATENLILSTFLNARRLRLFGLAPVNEEREPFIVSEFIDEVIDQNLSGKAEAFLRAALDQLIESLIEVGYIVSNTIDDFYASQRAALDADEERVVVVTPNEEVSDEKLVLQGKQTDLTQTLQTTLATHTLVHNRDVGQIVGQNYDDWYRAKPYRRNLSLVFKDKDTPPYVVNGITSKTVTINVPDVRAGLSWEKIKLACEPFTWGPVKVEQKLDNGRKFLVNAASFAEGKRVISRMLTLTTANAQGPPRQSQPEQDNLPPELKILPSLVYPAYGSLTVREFTFNSQANTYQKNKQASARFELWTERQPENFKNLPS